MTTFAERSTLYLFYEVLASGGYKEMSSILADLAPLEYQSKCGGRGGGGRCGVTAKENTFAVCKERDMEPLQKLEIKNQI